jgi:hypothetical protein
VIETAILISLLMQCIATLFRNFVGGLVLRVDNVKLTETRTGCDGGTGYYHAQFVDWRYVALA